MTLEQYMSATARGAALEATATQGDPRVFAGLGAAMGGGLPIRKSLPLGALSAVGGGTGAGALVLYALIAAGGGYFAGKAMAPSPSQQTAYSIAGAVGSVFLGPIGLGAVGVYALMKR